MPLKLFRRWFVVALAMMSWGGGVGAQVPAAKVEASPVLAGVAHVALRVHDLAASEAFYESLGFVKAFELSKDGKVYEAFIKINDRQFIELYPTTTKETQVGFLHVCFEGGDLRAAHDYYVQQGLTPKDVKTAGAGNLLFTMPGPMTPNGPENMEYTQYMPGSLHSKDFGQHLGAQRLGTRIDSVAFSVDDPAAAESFYVEKAGFRPVGQGEVELPGTSGETLRLVPSKDLEFRMRLTLAGDPLRAAVALRQRGVMKMTTGVGPAGQPQLAVMDPDGNEIVFRTTR
jgi:catechol 2,3-dioxygenase-like lactoylglutathione lyase family enzyme